MLNDAQSSELEVGAWRCPLAAWELYKNGFPKCVFLRFFYTKCRCTVESCRVKLFLLFLVFLYITHMRTVRNRLNSYGLVYCSGVVCCYCVLCRPTYHPFTVHGYVSYCGEHRWYCALKHHPQQQRQQQIYRGYNKIISWVLLPFLVPLDCHHEKQCASRRNGWY